MLTYTGIIVKIGETNRVSEKFRKRDLVLTDGAASYPQTILFQFTQKNCELMDGFNVGDEATVIFALKGREWTNKEGKVSYFNSLDAFRISKGAKPTTNNFQETFTPDGMDLPF